MGSMINQLTAQLALQACEGIMVERLNAQFPTRQFLPRWLKDVPETYDSAVNLFRPKVQQRSDSHKAKFCKEIEQIQTGLDMLGKTPRELAGLIDRAFACIAVNPGLTFANVSESHPRLMCQYSNIFENCTLSCKGENCTGCLAGEGDRYMPWQCWHPHYWGAPLYILFDLAVDYLNDRRYNPALVKDIAGTRIFLESLDSALSPEYTPAKSSIAVQEEQTRPNEQVPSTLPQESSPDEPGDHELIKLSPEFRDMLSDKCIY